MKKWNYYNDFDPKVCEWARELIKRGLVPDGEVDCRSICEVQAEDVRDFVQCHFFCGILGWSYAMRLAGWPDDRKVWTGSCPCQPFSCAGKQLGQADVRHLWPEFFRLIRDCRPERVFGEQVEGAVGKGWLDGVFADLEGEDYACGAAVLGAHSAGAPHIRQRLFWVAHADGGQPRDGGVQPGREHGQQPQDDGARGLGYTNQSGPQGRIERGHSSSEWAPWSASVGLLCTDGKTRRIPTEPALFPMVDGFPVGRVGVLRGGGNAIVPQVAAHFIQAAEESAKLTLQ